MDGSDKQAAEILHRPSNERQKRLRNLLDLSLRVVDLDARASTLRCRSPKIEVLQPVSRCHPGQLSPISDPPYRTPP